MPLPGGSADKLGNSYEAKWLVKQMIKLLDGNISSLYLEPVGDDGEKIELYATTPAGIEVGHQVKRQNAGKGVWTLSELNTRGVIEGIKHHVIGLKRHFVFVSSDSVRSIKELCERSKQASCFDSFKKDFLTTSDYRTDFIQFVRSLSVDEYSAFDALNKIEFRLVDELTLGEDNIGQLERLFEGDGKAIHSIIFQFGFDNVHQIITAKELYQYLLECGFSATDIGKDSSLYIKYCDYIDDYSASYQFDLDGKGTVIERKQTGEIVTLLSAANPIPPLIFLTGRAGCGKSGVIGQVIVHCQASDMVVLPLRFDRLDPTNSLQALGEQIIGKKVSPDTLLSKLAHNRKALLVVEQLDAVSTVSGRNPEFFEAVARLIRHAVNYQNLAIIVVCRSYDLANDARFRQLQVEYEESSRQIDVCEFSLDETKAALVRLHFDTNLLTDSELKLLQLPVHLSMFVTIRTAGDSTHSFKTAKDLFDQYWTFIETHTQPNLSDPNHMGEILYRASKTMSESGRLSVPLGMFRQWRADLNKLISANILKEYQQQVGFFHESFFDYTFARFFVEDGLSLHDFVTSGEQGLFIRATIRQVLTFQRDENINEYFRQLNLLLDDNDIRFHIKKLIVSFIGQVDTPYDDEWAILQNLINKTGNPLCTEASRVLRFSSAWFAFLCDKEIVHRWLRDDAYKEFCLDICFSNLTTNCARVAQLFKPLIGVSFEQDLKVARFSRFTRVEVVDSEIVRLIEALIEKYGSDFDTSKQLFDVLLSSIGHKDYKLYCFILGCYLQSLFGLSFEKNPLISYRDEQAFKDYDLVEASKKEPKEFVEQVFEPVLQLIEQHARPAYRSNELMIESIWGFSHCRGSLLMRLLLDTIKNVIDDEPEYAIEIYNRLYCIEIETAHLMLLEILIAAECELAVNYLIEHWKKWGIWYNDYGLWLAGNLIRSAIPLLSVGMVLKLEILILDHWEKWDQTDVDNFCGGDKRKHFSRFRHWLGIDQLKLLSAIGSTYLSIKGKYRLGELQRKCAFNDWDINKKTWGIRGGMSCSPLDENITVKMTEQQWLNAMQRYKDDSDEIWLEDRVIGGASELARQLQELTKSEPSRFSNLLFRMPDFTNHHYFDQIALGLYDDKSPLNRPIEVVERLIKQCANDSGRWIVNIIANNIDVDCEPYALIKRLEEFALSDEDPTIDDEGDSHFDGINSVRGSAAGAIGNIIWKSEKCWQKMRPTIEMMVEDKSIAVRTCVAEICIIILNYDREAAIDLFLRLVDIDDRLLACRAVRKFMWYTCDDEFERIKPVLERMIRSPINDVRVQAGTIAAGAYLYGTIEPQLFGLVMNGDIALRENAAKIFADNVLNIDYQSLCVQQLIPLFDDENKDVRKAAAEWFQRRDTEIRMAPALVDLLEVFCRSEAILLNFNSNLKNLYDDVELPPKLLFDVVDKFVESQSDSKMGEYRQGHHIGDLLLRVYRQADTDRALRKQCLDSFDKFLSCELYDIGSALVAFER